MKKTGTGWRGFLTLSLAAALAGAAPAGALAASPEFARTPEEWERLRDNTLEYEEIPDLIREYNSTVQNNMISYGDYRGKDANEIAEDYREAAQTLYDSVVWPSEDDTGYAMLYSAAETAQAQARQLEKMADENVSDGMIIKWQYDQVEASLSSTAQNLMSQYYQLLENRKTAEAGTELAETSLRSVETQASLGMATENDVLTEVGRHSLALLKALDEEANFDALAELTRAVENSFLMETGQPVYIGVSQPRDDLSLIAESFEEARNAINIGRVYNSTSTIFFYDRLLLERFLYDLPVDVSARYSSQIFNRQTAKLFNDEMLHTIETFFENSLNLSETARKLYIHRNTLVYRLEKVQRAIGLDLRSFDDAVTFKMMMLLGKNTQSRKNRL